MSEKNNFEVFHILVSHEYEASDILLKLRTADQFSEFALKYSKCSSAKNGGSLGVFKSGRFVESFEDACDILHPGQISRPVRTQFGWHIILKR
jgi:peptidyl-prolyl cis-trans isomerase C